MSDQPKLDLVVLFKIMPEDAELDIQKLGDAVLATAKEVAPASKVQNIEFKPVAFGLKAIMMTILMSDGAGGPDTLEDALNNLDGVGSAGVDQMGRI